MRHFLMLSVAVLSLSVFVLSGCAGDIKYFTKPYEIDVTAENYPLQPPDEVEILCSKVPELNNQRQRIRPDGKISFERLGEVKAAGKTPVELASVLEEKASKLYKLAGEKPIDVRVVAYRSKSFYVLGQVLRPGPKDYTGRDTLLSALAEARPNPMAWEEVVKVIRPSAEEDIKPKVFQVNYFKMIKKGDISKNVLLEENDIVYVPPTIPAAVALMLEEVLRPIARAFTGIYMAETPPTESGRYIGRGGGYR